MYQGSFLLIIASSVLQAVATTVPIVSCTVNQPQLFTNPSFEDGSWDGWTKTDSSSNAAIVDASSSGSPFSTAAEGQYYIKTINTALRGGDALFLSQTVNGLDTSTTYTITFSIAGVPNGGSTQLCQMYVFKDSQTNANLLVEDVIDMDASGLPWTQYSLGFTPTATSHLMLFVLECYDTEYYVGLDDLQFLEPATTVCSTSYSTAVPSPTTSSQAVTSQAVTSSQSVTASSSQSVGSSISSVLPSSSSIGSSALPTSSDLSSSAIPSSAVSTNISITTSPAVSPSTTPMPSITSGQVVVVTQTVYTTDMATVYECPA
ncbi:hypothetical protein ASPZODRAFT_132966 [Penicilliopsis zonata CBS 506.65]|uniref:CBM-cenC domain-containing protein n=1 Tax=Penicilliopsis zonata CBS 506.65 TaxID=1073090 RepID=A0A1L9SFT0_9EURO|nr:hypothetical protein ASPZODRAFT_132966 [Penicilliopsis zonata CBS 506.65]OJJ45983.1 hypothetical protein ASPZODRAFT_132966 [Penicilliopsis zonata CBS 506.65]